MKDIAYGSAVRSKLLSGARKTYKAVASAYGPLSGNVLLEKTFGDPTLSHDGVTIARDVELEDHIENMAAKLLVQASDQTNKVAGDGTTATVILAYHIFKEAYNRVAAGANPMELRQGILQASRDIVAAIDAMKVDVTDAKLVSVATIASGDKAYGQLIAEAIKDVGKDGGVFIEDYQGYGVIHEIVNGYYIEAGLSSSAMSMANDESGMGFSQENMPIIVIEPTLSTAKDAIELLKPIANSDNKSIMVIGDVVGDALTVLANARRVPQLGLVTAVSVGMPVHGGMKSQFMEDLAIQCGCKVIRDTRELAKLEVKDLGMAEHVVVKQDSAYIIGGIGDKEKVAVRLNKINKQLKEETNPIRVEFMEKRLAKLSGGVALIKVGGVNETEIKETKMRIEDAVLATKAAREDGIVPGGATAVLHVKPLAIEVGYDCVFGALDKPFKKLLNNANFNADYKLQQVLDAKPGYGFNIQKMTDKPIDLIKAGVVDPAKVIKQVVTNACSIAANLITTGAAITIKDKDADSSN